MNKQKNSSWEHVSNWYDDVVGSKGHFYHRELIFPNLLKKLPKKNNSLLDLACGQGVFAGIVPKSFNYTGCDLSESLIERAKEKGIGDFFVSDVSKPLDIEKKDFDLASIILAIQDIPNIEGVFQNAAQHLRAKGSFFIVMNHPCFRIPRISSWGIDEGQNMLYRRVNSYISEHNIPIQTKPSAKALSETVTSHHRPISTYIKALSKAGFGIVSMDEWICPKKSTGKYAKRENRAREEFPMFLCIEARLF